MRNYLILADKAAAFDADPRVHEVMELASVPELGELTVSGYTTQAARDLGAEHFDYDALAKRSYHNEALDQLVIDHIFGVAD
jgi:xylose isomerase